MGSSQHNPPQRNQPERNQPGRTPAAAPKAKPSWFRGLFTPAMFVVIAVSVIGAVYGIYLSAKDGGGDVWYATWIFIGSLTLPTVWSIMSTLWRPSQFPPIMDALARTVVVPLVTVWPGAIAAGIAVLLPPINHIIVDARRPKDGWHYMFAADEGSPLGTTLGLGGLMGIIIAMLLGLFLSIFLVLPWEAWVNPKRAIEGNMLDASTEAAVTANTAAMKMFSILLMLVFAIPTLIIVGKDNARAYSVGEAFANVPRFLEYPADYWGDLMWVAGIVLIPLGLILMFAVRSKQKPRAA